MTITKDLPPLVTQDPEVAALTAAFDTSGLIFHDRPATLAAFRADREIVYEDGAPYALYDGVVAPLSEQLAKFGADNRTFIDGRSLPRHGVDASRPGDLSKADFKTVTEKVAFITEHGGDAFERLPTQKRDTSELKTFTQWLKLPITERVRLTNLDPNIIGKLEATKPARQGQDGATLAEHNARTNPNHRGPGWSRKFTQRAS